jgi:hypothetical protein
VVVDKKPDSETGNSVTSGQRYPSIKKVIAATKRSVSTKGNFVVNKTKQTNIILSDERRDQRNPENDLQNAIIKFPVKKEKRNTSDGRK